MICPWVAGHEDFPYGSELAEQKDMLFERIEAQTRDHYRGCQDICAFDWRDTHYQVSAILDRWHEGYIDPTRLPLRYFRVKTEDGQVFIIRYHAFFDAWSILVPD